MNAERPLYLITDGGVLRQQGRLQLVMEQVVSEFGSRIFALQIREQGGDFPATDEEVLSLARGIRALTSSHDIRLLLSRRLDLALRAAADGVHLGFRRADDGKFDASELSSVQQAGLSVGISLHSRDEALEVEPFKPDYVFLSPVFQTLSKDMRGRTALGLPYLQNVCRNVATPVIALGGVDPGNIREVLSTGAAGVAVISSGLGASDPVNTVRNLLRQV